ncbi:mannosyltransferase putative-domain-containing protein [Chytriomyces sp. MP71]|nr:mannosyltransferase putative-domain-containing protein [Chytriomyces sp. MP71]
MTATEYLLPRLYPWLSYSSIENAMATWKGRGIAFTFPTSGYARGVHLILTLRNILRCTLPIEIFYIGDKDLAFEKRRELSKLSGVTLIDIQERLPLVTEVHGFNIKPFVMLASSFREVIFMDDDVTMLQNPDALLDASALYSKYGTLFFLDRSFSGGNSEWVRSFVPHPSAASLGSRYMTNVSRDEQESSLVVLDKGRVGIVHALLAACHMNLKESRDEALHKHTHGDKESFWIAHELVRTPYAFVPGIGGAAGFFRTKQGIKEPDVVCGPQSHIDEERRLTHFNGLTLKYKDDPSKGYLDFHHYVAPVLENPGNVDIGYHPWCVHSRKPAEEVIEFNEREKGVIGKIIELHKELVKSEFAVPA